MLKKNKQIYQTSSECSICGNDKIGLRIDSENFKKVHICFDCMSDLKIEMAVVDNMD